jgi:hypothetical protein
MDVDYYRDALWIIRDRCRAYCCAFFLLFLKEKKKKEGINALLNRTVEWKGFFL